MHIIPQLFKAKVMHSRLSPEKNRFIYSVFYLVLPLPAVSIGGCLVSFAPKDLGYRDGTDPVNWAKALLYAYNFAAEIEHLMLITMPAVFGYVFNPVSFYLGLDSAKQLRVVIAEVHNTFGEQHTYLCAHPDHRPILPEDWLEADKMFHVSPFLERTGYYRFRFAFTDKTLGIWINYFNKAQNKQLVTSLTGNLYPLTTASLYKTFLCHPLVAFKTIVLIHWQALKLLTKKIGYITKPEPRSLKVTTSFTTDIDSKGLVGQETRKD